MSDDDNPNTVDQPYRLPALFSADMPILIDQGIGIAENLASGLKADTMLGLVDPVLVLIPFKLHAAPPQACNDKYVATNPQPFKPAA